MGSDQKQPTPQTPAPADSFLSGAFRPLCVTQHSQESPRSHAKEGVQIHMCGEQSCLISYNSPLGHLGSCCSGHWGVWGGGQGMESAQQD